MKCFILTVALILSQYCFSQSPTGKWKKISHLSEYGGQKFDSHKALLTQRPCAAKIVFEMNTDGSFRLNASASGCDESYRKIQEKLYAESVWTVKGNRITIGNKKTPAIGQTYTFVIKGNTMIWTGTDGQGVITYTKL